MSPTIPIGDGGDPVNGHGNGSAFSLGDERRGAPGSVPFKEYLDSQLAEVRRAVLTAATAQREEGVPLKEFIEAVLDEQRRGMVVAEQEREKSAAALRSDLERQITAGDHAVREMFQQAVSSLRDHFDQQVDQIQNSLDSAERLEMERIGALRRESEQITQANVTSVAKSEELNKERWEGANEWRDQSADRERSQQEEMTRLTATFLRADTATAQFTSIRESVDTQIGEIRRMASDLSEKMSKLV